MKLRGIIVLEGADCSGKTTLARYFVGKYGARYLHSRVVRHRWRNDLAITRLALRWADSGLVVIDRLWLSELIYGETYRGGPSYDLGARCLDRVMQRAAAVTVICSPSDQEKQIAKHAERNKSGREAFTDIRAVVAAYADLVHGNLARPGDGYLGQLVRYGDFTARRDVFVYDFDRSSHNLSTVAGKIMVKLHDRRTRQLPPGLDSRQYNFVGSWDTARVLFVSNTRSSCWPSVWHGESMTTSVNRALHMIGWDETRAIWTNVVSADDQLPNLLSGPFQVIALGGAAADRVQSLVNNQRDVRLILLPNYYPSFDDYVVALRVALR